MGSIAKPEFANGKTMANPNFATRFDMAVTLTNERTDVLTNALLNQGEKSYVPNTPRPVDKGSVITIPVTLPHWVWGRLATIAEETSLEVPGLIADAIRQTIDDHPRVKFQRASRLGILEQEVIAARAAGLRAPGTHTSSKGNAA